MPIAGTEGGALVADSRVPKEYDVVIDGIGYMLHDGGQGELAVHTNTTHFIQRQNVSGEYGDDFQDFWLTADQTDFSGGEGQRYFRTQEDEKRRRYWDGTANTWTAQGEFSLGPKRNTHNPGTYVAPTGTGAHNCITAAGYLYTSDAGNAYHCVSKDGAWTSRASGLAGGISTLVYHRDGTNGERVYASDGTTVRMSTPGSTFAAFSASGADRLVSWNRTLWGTATSGGVLNRLLVSFDTAGTRTTAQDMGSSVLGMALLENRLILATADSNGRNAFLWSFDGTAVAPMSSMPDGVQVDTTSYGNCLYGVDGVLYVMGRHVNDNRACVYYVAQGQLGLLWRSEDSAETIAYAGHSIEPGRLAFVTNQRVYVYDQSRGAMAKSGVAVTGPVRQGAIAAFDGGWHVADDTAFYSNYGSATSSYVVTSLVDYENTLTKLYREIKLEHSLPALTSIDVAYTLTSVDGATYTTIGSASSGTETTLPFPNDLVGRSIALRFTLNLNAGTQSPKLYRWFLKAAPFKPIYRQSTYVLRCVNQVEKRNRDQEPHTGVELAQHLRATASSNSIVGITDSLGFYEGIIQSDNLELHETHRGGYVARVTCRAVK